jgi:hypothetical protein
VNGASSTRHIVLLLSRLGNDSSDVLHMYGWRQFEFGSFINHDAQAQCCFGNQAYSRLIATSVNTWG